MGRVSSARNFHIRHHEGNVIVFHPWIPQSAVILDAESYIDLFEKKSISFFDSLPLSRLSSNARGNVLEELARREEERPFGKTRPPPPREFGRVPNQFDWIGHDGSRIEAMSVKLTQNGNRWRFKFRQGSTRLVYPSLLVSCGMGWANCVRYPG